VAPADGVADRALAQRQVERAADQELEPVFELPEDGRRREVPHARRGQLDRQRQAVELVADLRDHAGVEVQVRSHRVCPLFEQRGGGRQFERRHRELVLAAQPQRAAAGHQEGGLRAAQQQGVDERHRRGEVLEGVHHDERPRPGQAPGQQIGQLRPRLHYADHLGQLGPDQGRVPQLAQRDEEDAAVEEPPNLGRGLQCQPGLADATRAGQRQQPDLGVLEPLDDARQLAGAAEEPGGRDR
jgi:hypothetical protein